MHAEEWAGGDFGLLEIEAAKAEGVEAREGAGINENLQAGGAATFEELLNYWWGEENNKETCSDAAATIEKEEEEMVRPV